jgi:hypothetical protein
MQWEFRFIRSGNETNGGFDSEKISAPVILSRAQDDGGQNGLEIRSPARISARPYCMVPNQAGWRDMPRRRQAKAGAPRWIENARQPGYFTVMKILITEKSVRAGSGATSSRPAPTESARPGEFFTLQGV